MAKKGETKYNKSLGVFIANKIEEGMTLKQVHEQYPEVPTPKCIIEWKKKFPEFNQAVKDAYGTRIYLEMDEMKELSEELLKVDEELRKRMDSAAKSGDEEHVKEALLFAKLHSATLRDRRDNIRVRLRTIEFNLSRLAHTFLSEFKEPPRATASVQLNVPSVQIISYKDIVQDESNLIEAK